MDRQEALDLLHSYIKSPNMISHCIASEAVMRALALRFGEDPGRWGLAGLLHDLDVELVEGDMTRHGHETKRILLEKGFDEEFCDTILMHNESASGRKRTTPFQHALAAGETITGMIVATTLVYPDKKIASVKPKSVIKRMKEKKFAASVRRENIMECEKLGLTLQEFVEIALSAMCEKAGELDL
ncbi:MAG: HDIG domain-containing protein [Bacteroidales bacterium]